MGPFCVGREATSGHPGNIRGHPRPSGKHPRTSADIRETSVDIRGHPGKIRGHPRTSGKHPRTSKAYSNRRHTAVEQDNRRYGRKRRQRTNRTACGSDVSAILIRTPPLTPHRKVGGSSHTVIYPGHHSNVHTIHCGDRRDQHETTHNDSHASKHNAGAIGRSKRPQAISEQANGVSKKLCIVGWVLPRNVYRRRPGSEPPPPPPHVSGEQ